MQYNMPNTVLLNNALKFYVHKQRPVLFFLFYDNTDNTCPKSYDFRGIFYFCIMFFVNVITINYCFAAFSSSYNYRRYLLFVNFNKRFYFWTIIYLFKIITAWFLLKRIRKLLIRIFQDLWRIIIIKLKSLKRVHVVLNYLIKRLRILEKTLLRDWLNKGKEVIIVRKHIIFFIQKLVTLLR